MLRLNLNKKLIIGGILVALVPLILVAALGVIKATGALDELARGQALRIAQNLAALVQSRMTQELAKARTLAADPALQASLAGGPDPAAAMARQAQALGQDYQAVALLDASGKVRADGLGAWRPGSDLSGREWFGRLQAGRPVISRPYLSQETNLPLVVVAAPIPGPGGAFRGAVALVLDTRPLSARVIATRVGQTGYPWMTDQEGLLISHPNPKHVLKTNLAKLKEMAGFMQRLIAGGTGVGEYDFEGQHKICGYAPVPVTGWGVGFTQNSSEFLAAAGEIRDYSALIALVALMVTVLAVWFFAQSISRPITKASAMLNRGSREVAAAAGEVATAGQSLARGTSEQAAAVEETSASLEELSAMTQRNDDSSNRADGLMRKVSAQADEASQSLGEMKTSMGEISDAGQEIAGIIKSIDEIAFQTNLLALNAAVEAARAGEAGAGFAVVAEEVRNLALRAAEAARSTTELIEGTIGKINHGVALVGRVDEAFGAVTGQAAQVAELVAQIASASHEQSQGLDQINQALTQIERVTQSVAANAQESAAAAEELSAQAGGISDVAGSLTRVVSGGREADEAPGRRSAAVGKGRGAGQALLPGDLDPGDEFPL